MAKFLGTVSRSQMIRLPRTANRCIDMVHLKHVTLLAALTVFTAPGLGDRATAQAVVVKVQPGEFVVDHPTLINLGFEWVIQGDDNRNANVDVSYRKQG